MIVTEISMTLFNQARFFCAWLNVVLIILAQFVRDNNKKHLHTVVIKLETALGGFPRSGREPERIPQVSSNTWGLSHR